MRMKNICFVIVFSLLVVLPVVSALETPINIRTISGHRVHILILEDSGMYNLLDSFHINSDGNGECSVVYSGSEDSIKVNVQIDKNGEKVMLEKFGPLKTGEPLYLQVKPRDVSDNYMELERELSAEEDKDVEDVVNETEEVSSEENVEDVVNETEEVSSDDGDKLSITGKAIFENLRIPQSVYYVIGGVLVLGVLAFLVFKAGPGVVNAIPKRVSPSGGDYGNQLEDAERRIKEAQEEIAQLKNKDKISAAEKKLEEDKKLLDSLKKGEIDESDKLNKWEDEN